MFVHCTKCTKRKREQTEKPTNPVKIWPYRISNFFYVVSKRRKFRLGKMYNLLGITQSKLRTYGNGNPFNYLGDDHLILRGGGGWQILLGHNVYFQFFAGQNLYFRLLQDWLFISGYNNVVSGGQARLFFYFLGHTAPPPESNGRPLSTYCAKR